MMPPTPMMPVPMPTGSITRNQYLVSVGCPWTFTNPSVFLIGWCCHVPASKYLGTLGFRTHLTPRAPR